MGGARTSDTMQGMCFAETRGWAWLKQCAALMGWEGEGPALRCCFKRRTNKSNIPFTDPSLNAIWRGTLITHQIFIQLLRLSGGFVSELWDTCGLKLEHVSLDLMHVGDLGILLVLFGNVFFELFQACGGLVTKPEAMMSDLLALIKSASKAIGQDRPPINAFKFSMLKDKAKAPVLKLKAAESRHMLPVLLYILENYFIQDTAHKIARYTCVKKIALFYEEMRKPDTFFDGVRAAKLAREHLILYADLGRHARESLDHQRTGFLMWRWIPKHHLFSHFEQQVFRLGSPAGNWCYWDESAIGECARVAESCHSKTLHRLIMRKHRIEW